MDEQENGAVAWLTLQEMHACGPALGQGSTTDEKKVPQYPAHAASCLVLLGAWCSSAGGLLS